MCWHVIYMHRDHIVDVIQVGLRAAETWQGGGVPRYDMKT